MSLTLTLSTSRRIHSEGLGNPILSNAHLGNLSAEDRRLEVGDELGTSSAILSPLFAPLLLLTRNILTPLHLPCTRPHASHTHTGLTHVCEHENILELTLYSTSRCFAAHAIWHLTLNIQQNVIRMRKLNSWQHRQHR